MFAQSAKGKVIGGAEEARFAAREGTGETKNPLEPGIGIIRNSGFPTGCRRIVTGTALSPRASGLNFRFG